jgi:hypothetical protein
MVLNHLLTFGELDTPAVREGEAPDYPQLSRTANKRFTITLVTSAYRSDLTPENWSL